MVIEGQSISFKWSSGSVVVMIVWHLDLQLSVQSVPIIANVVSSNLAQMRCTRYNIMWYSLSVTSDRSVVFSGYSGFLHTQKNKTPQLFLEHLQGNNSCFYTSWFICFPCFRWSIIPCNISEKIAHITIVQLNPTLKWQLNLYIKPLSE